MGRSSSSNSSSSKGGPLTLADRPAALLISSILEPIYKMQQFNEDLSEFLQQRRNARLCCPCAVSGRRSRNHPSLDLRGAAGGVCGGSPRLRAPATATAHSVTCTLVRFLAFTCYHTSLFALAVTLRYPGPTHSNPTNTKNTVARRAGMMGMVRLLLSTTHLGPMWNGTCVPSWAVVGRTGQDLAARVDQRALKVSSGQPGGQLSGQPGGRRR